MNTKQPEAFALAQKLENAPAWESQSLTIHGWNDSGKTLADAAAELRRLHSDYETLRGFFAEIVNELHHKLLSARHKLDAAQRETASLQAQLKSADDRLQDMLLADDGQADKEARKYLERRAQPAVQTQRTGLCCRSHPHEKQGMQCQLLEVSAVLRWHAAAFAAPSAESMLLYADQVDAVAHALPAVQPKSANEMTAKRTIGAFSN